MKIYHLLNNNGLEFCAYRTWYALRKKTGLLKQKFPTFSWESASLTDWLRPCITGQFNLFLKHHRSNGKRFFFDSNNVLGLNKNYHENVRIQADKILNHRFTWFFNQEHDLGENPDWLWSPLTKQRLETNHHWCDIAFFDATIGDIKYIWEQSRFAWAYTLARAWAATGDKTYSEKFWTLFESWLKANPANVGPNYACGQECAIRLMAMTFVYYALLNAPATSEKRLKSLILAIAVHADRIENNIDFAISTRTNHSITEAAGIYTVGLLFPELKYSKRWRERGKQIITTEGIKQIYSDGGYIQHSMNYHRLMLQNFIWVLRLAQLNDDNFDSDLIRRVQAAVNFLYQMQDPTSGHVPNYGANDGALIIPLNACDYLEYRPVIQSAHYLFHKKKLYSTGLWDEDLCWLFGPQAREAPLESLNHISQQFTYSGYYTLRQNDNWMMTRCHSFQDRPGHADMLHFDLWWKGINILRDSGSYLYNCPQPWQSYFGSTTAHNTVSIDHQDQMQKAGRFQWFHWTKALAIHYQTFDSHPIVFMQGEHYGYHRLEKELTHRRGILGLDNHYWIIIDDILGHDNHQLNLFWHLCPGKHHQQDNRIDIYTPYGRVMLSIVPQDEINTYQLVNGKEFPIAGWQSLYYGQRLEAPVFICSRRTKLPTRFITLVGLEELPENILIDKNHSLSWIGNSKSYIVELAPAVTTQNHIFMNVKFDNHQIPISN